MAREERFRENHENYSEYFPVLNKVKRRTPKFSKSSATLVSTLTVAASVALVTALFLVCRVLYIEPTCIKLEVNSQGGSVPVQYAVIRSELLSGLEDGSLPDLSEADKTGALRGGTEVVHIYIPYPIFRRRLEIGGRYGEEEIILVREGIYIETYIIRAAFYQFKQNLGNVFISPFCREGELGIFRSAEVGIR